MASPPKRKKRLRCVECGAHTVIAHRWRAYRTDVEPGDPPAVAFYCPGCAAAEFGSAVPGGEPNKARRHRDANRAGAVTFRVTLEAVVTSTTTDSELGSAFDALTAAGATDIAVPSGDDDAYRRIEFDLEANNRGHALRLAKALLDALAAATPSIADGWILASLSPA